MEAQPVPDAFLGSELRRYAALLWHWAWLLALATVLGGVSAFVVSKRMTPVYQASTRVLIDQAPSTRGMEYQNLITSERLAQTYAELLTSQPVLDEVRQRLELEAGVGAVTVQPVRDTQLIEIRVQHTDPVRAAEVANTLVTVFSEQNLARQASRYAASKESLAAQLAELDRPIQETGAALAALGENPEDTAERERLATTLAQYRNTYAAVLQSYEALRIAEAQSISNLVQVERAKPPRVPIRPKVAQNTILAAIVGLMIAVGIAFLIEALDDTLRSPDDVHRHLGLPVLGFIAKHDSEVGKPVTVAHPRSSVAEAYRSLRSNAQFASVDRPLHTLLVTSPMVEDGKTEVAVNLAVVLAHSGLRTALLDADLRRSMVHKRVGLRNLAGLADLFVQPQIHLDGSMQSTQIPYLSVMTAGKRVPYPSELLGSQKMEEILRQVVEQTDVVVIDSPPVLAVTDPAVLAPRVDGVILVVRPGITKLRACQRAVEQLRRAGANLLGVVLNHVETGRSGYHYYYYYRDGYYYSQNDRYYTDGDGGKKRKKRDRKRQRPQSSSKSARRKREKS